MEKVVLKAVVRQTDKPVSQTRSNGQIPAELYGHNVQNLHLALAQNEFEKVLRRAGEPTIIALEIEGVGERNVLIQEVQVHPVRSTPLHADFYEVKMTEKLTATVPIEYEGESQAVKAMGGTLVKVLDEVEVECLPADLPHNLTVNIDRLTTFDDVILVKDIPLPKGVVVTAEPEEVVAKVQPPRDVEAELAQPVVEDVTKVEGVVKEEPATEGETESK